MQVLASFMHHTTTCILVQWDDIADYDVSSTDSIHHARLNAVALL